jgi:hypothetical protein
VYSLRFDGQVFTLSVGSNKKMLSAHENAISQSPALKAFCSPHFKEGATKHIDLPDDDEETFEQLLRYLYTGAFKGTEEPIESELWSWAALYILADKYSVLELKRDIIIALELGFWHVQPVFHLRWLREVYSNVPESEKDIKGLFDNIIPDIFDHLTTEGMTEVEGIMEAGGRLALEILRYRNAKSKEYESTASNLQQRRELMEEEMDKHDELHVQAERVGHCGCIDRFWNHCIALP